MSVLAEQVKLVPHPIYLKNGQQFSLNLPANYEIIPAAEGLKRVRFFAKAPDGRMFVTDMHDLSDNKKGTIYILDEWNAETGKFGKNFTVYDSFEESKFCAILHRQQGTGLDLYC